MAHFRPALTPTPSACIRHRYPRLHRWIQATCQRPSVADSYHHDLVVRIYTPSVPDWRGGAVVKGRKKKAKTKALLDTLLKKGACQWSCE